MTRQKLEPLRKARVFRVNCPSTRRHDDAAASFVQPVDIDSSQPGMVDGERHKVPGPSEHPPKHSTLALLVLDLLGLKYPYAGPATPLLSQPPR